MKGKIIKLILSVLFITAFVCSSNFVQAKTINHKFVEENRKDIDDILLGNSSSKILNGGLSASYEDKYFYATDEGIRLVENSNEQIIISDNASYINISDEKLYYIAYQEEESIIKETDFYGKNSKELFKDTAKITNMYVIDGDIITFLVEGNVYKLNIRTNKCTKVEENLDIISFIPTKYGFIYATENNEKLDLWINDKNIVTVESYYVEDDYLITSIVHETFQISLKKLFDIDVNFKLEAKAFDLYGKMAINEILSNDTNAEFDIANTNITEEEIEKDKKYLKKKNMMIQESDFLHGTTSFSLRNTVVDGIVNSGMVAIGISNGQVNIIKRARQMVEFQWTPLKDVSGWAGATIFKKGNTYMGVPYGQCSNRGSWLGYGTSLDLFKRYINDSSSLLYTSTASNGSKIAPYYSNDCSTFLSYCWELTDRKSTSSIPNVEGVTKITQSDNSIIQVGDCLNASGNHAILVTGRVYNDIGELIGYDIMHQTPPKATKVSSISLAAIDKYFSQGYVVYRYDKRNDVTYKHCCSVPINDDKCVECDVNSTEQSTMCLTMYTAPTTLKIGQSFSIKGEISSNYKIREVTVGIYTTSGTKVISATATPWLNEYNVIDLDSKIKFGSLSEGTYIYKVIATDKKGTKVLLSRTFSVSKGASTLGISSYTYPTSLKIGQSFSLKGKIMSNYKIISVTVGVYTTSGNGKITAVAYPNTYSYNISNLDAKIKFGSLSAGTYVYKVTASDENGRKTLLSKTFTVK